MANFYTDNSDLKFQLSHPLMRKIVELKEQIASLEKGMAAAADKPARGMAQKEADTKEYHTTTEKTIPFRITSMDIF